LLLVSGGKEIKQVPVKTAYVDGIYRMPDESYVVLYRDILGTARLVPTAIMLQHNGDQEFFGGYPASKQYGAKQYLEFDGLGEYSKFTTPSGTYTMEDLKFTGKRLISDYFYQKASSDMRKLNDIQKKAKEFFGIK
jgi:hypothetical protein